ncbi:hypothetical protein FPOA_08993 [Fusarium poae]|uniref:Zn(2)-C6 fungal-type domain-containing protein n=1 Tax=Fusarium poae TaxID=36050 RepID=A0A1B8AQB0_FUSPO|nr:hypothetical protein FPOA_08993 [Fusarium poae]
MIITVEQEKPVSSASRKSHARSRTGCSQCKNRRVRCDEQRPVCLNCDTSGLSCNYAAPSMPLRERRKSYLPGEQQPWAVAVKPAPVALPKPINICFPCPIEMPLKSMELLQYFHKAGSNNEVTLQCKRQNVLASNIHHPDALRNTLLIAGFHYLINGPRFSDFKPTLLLHKIETIRSVNKWIQLSDSKAYAMCVRQISTLCFSECYLGHSRAAETHLNGLMKFLDIYCPLGLANPTEPSNTTELSIRYIMLTYSFISICKSRVRVEIVDVGEGATPEVMAAMHDRFKFEAGGVDLKLRSMELLPYFFAPLSSMRGFHDIDASPMIDCLLSLTEIFQLRAPVEDERSVQQILLIENTAVKLTVAAIETHVESMPGQDDRTRKKKSLRGLDGSWSGLFIASHLYVHQILGLWTLDAPLEVKFHSHILGYLSWDLAKSDSCLEQGSIVASNFWFWKAFVGAFSLARHIETDHAVALYPLRRQFVKFIYKWSECAGIKTWKEAREILIGIVWPKSAFIHGSLAEMIWYESQVKIHDAEG